MSAKFKIIAAMIIFGSIGFFVKNIDLPSSGIAFLRAVIGSGFLLVGSCFLGELPTRQAIRENIVLLIFSGVAIGFNWILLFQAYKYTTISNATLCYYLAPIFVIIMAPIILKERLTIVKIVSVAVAMLGLVLIVNVSGSTASVVESNMTGILYGVSAAVLYASVIIMNKMIRNLSGFITAFIQIFTAAIVLFPYVILIDHITFTEIDHISIVNILLLGIVHTGIAYFLYFTSMKELKGQTIAALSYIDPIMAVIISSVFLGERLSIVQVLGGMLILCATVLSEWFDVKNKK